MDAMLCNENNDDYLQDEENSPNEAPHRRISPIYDKIDLTNHICLDSPTDTTDAAPPPATMATTLTVDQVMVVEDHLDIFEKVSLVYLLYDNPAVALKHLTKLVNGSNDKLIHNWAIFQNIKKLKWQEELEEAFYIIQNYEILKMLGFAKDDLDVKFPPHLWFDKIYVNKIRKVLYRLCDAFDSTDGENLLRLVHTDFQKKGFYFTVYNPEYLELYLLHWESLGYIKQDNLSNLCDILNVMDQLDWCDVLRQLFPASSLSTQISVDKNANCDTIDRYDVDPKSPGVCLIINQEYFYREIEPDLQELLPPTSTILDTRTGTEHDKKKLIETFQQFGFRIETEDNLTHSDIPKKIEKVINSITTESSLFVCIMSHGDEGVIYGVNSCRVPVKELEILLCSKNRRYLCGKPKVLILQSCQGTNFQCIAAAEPDNDNIVMDGPSEVIPPLADLFTFWATVPGYGAIRDMKTGSWFIQSLCEKIITLADKYHFEDICTAVIQDVSSKTCVRNNERVAMVPKKENTPRKLFYFPPIRE